MRLLVASLCSLLAATLATLAMPPGAGPGQRSRERPETSRSTWRPPSVAWSTPGSPVLAAGAPAEQGVVRIEVVGLRNDRGLVRVALFSSAQGFPYQRHKAVASDSALIWGDRATVEFEGLAPGTYAAALIHDEDLDGELDKSAVGIPTEGWAITGTPRSKFRAPRFSEAAFTVEAGAVSRPRAPMIYY